MAKHKLATKNKRTNEIYGHWKDNSVSSLSPSLSDSDWSGQYSRIFLHCKCHNYVYASLRQLMVGFSGTRVFEGTI